MLDSYRSANRFEVYAGTHVDRVAVRLQDEVIPFFSRSLAFQNAPQIADRGERAAAIQR